VRNFLYFFIYFCTFYKCHAAQGNLFFHLSLKYLNMNRKSTILIRFHLNMVTPHFIHRLRSSIHLQCLHDWLWEWKGKNKLVVRLALWHKGRFSSLLKTIGFLANKTGLPQPGSIVPGVWTGVHYGVEACVPSTLSFARLYFHFPQKKRLKKKEKGDCHQFQTLVFWGKFAFYWSKSVVYSPSKMLSKLT